MTHTCPNHQQARLLLTHPSLPPGIVFDVGAVVIEEVALNIHLAGSLRKANSSVQRSGHSVPRWDRFDMARPRRLQRQQVGTKRAFVGGAVGPKGPTRLPDRAQPSLCATASWTMRPRFDPDGLTVMRNPRGRRNPACKACSARAQALR